MDNLKEEVESIDEKKEQHLCLQELEQSVELRKIDVRHSKASAKMQEDEVIRQDAHFQNQIKYDKMECARRNLECICKLMNLRTGLEGKFIEDKEIEDIAKKNLDVLGSIS